MYIALLEGAAWSLPPENGSTVLTQRRLDPALCCGPLRILPTSIATKQLAYPYPSSQKMGEMRHQRDIIPLHSPQSRVLFIQPARESLEWKIWIANYRHCPPRSVLHHGVDSIGCLLWGAYNIVVVAHKSQVLHLFPGWVVLVAFLEGHVNLGPCLRSR